MLTVDVSAEASLGPQSEVSLGESYVDGPVGGSFDGPSFGESCIEGSFDGPCGNRGPFDRSFPGQSTLAPPNEAPWTPAGLSSHRLVPYNMSHVLQRTGRQGRIREATRILEGLVHNE